MITYWNRQGRTVMTYIFRQHNVDPDSLLHVPLDNPSTRGLWSTVYAAASIFVTGYNLFRPTPGNDFGGIVTNLTTKLNDITNSIQTINQSINDIQNAIKNMPEVINGVVETNFIKDRLKEAEVAGLLLKSRTKNEAIWRPRTQDIEEFIYDKIFVNAGVVDDYYQANPQGPLTYLLMLAPILGPALSVFDYNSVLRWDEDNDSTGLDEYPFDEILSLSDVYLTDKIKEAYRKVISTSESLLATHETNANRVFPSKYRSTEDFIKSQRALYEYKNGNFEFFKNVDNTGMPPDPQYNKKYSGDWGVASGGSAWSNLYVTRYKENASKSSAAFSLFGGRPSDISEFRAAKATAEVIAESKHQVSRVEIITKNLNEHRDVLSIIESGQTWEIGSVK